MSHLHLPRIHFKGKFYANVPTANNDDIIKDMVDVASVTLNIPEHRIPAGTPETLDDRFEKWVAGGEDPDPKTIPPAGWNYKGDADCGFKEVSVKRIQHDNSPLPDPLNQVDFSLPDPLMHAEVKLNRAVMVDVDPKGILSSQIFCSGFKIKEGETTYFKGSPNPFYSRWHYSWRNLAFPGSFRGASAVWQAGIPKNSIEKWDTASPVIEALQEKAMEGQGIFIRFCTYFFTRKPNAPAYGQILGTIGPWLKDEMNSVTSGRLLYPFGRLFHNDEAFKLGPAVAHIEKDEQKVVLDLITTFPETNKDLEKINRGEVSLQLRYQNRGQDYTKTLGPVRYDKAAYEYSAGIVPLEYPEELEPHLDDGQLLLFFNDVGHHKLAEVDFVVETDQRGVYLQLQEKEEEGSKDIEFRVFKKGTRPQEKVVIKLEQYITTNFKGGPPPSTPAPPELHIVEMQDSKKKSIQEICVAPGDSNNPDAKDYLKGYLKLKPKRAGTCIIRFVLEKQPGKAFEYSFCTSFFFNVRVLPEDNYDILDEELTFEFVYEEVLRYYHLLYPDHPRFDLSKEKDAKAAIKAKVKTGKFKGKSYISKELFEAHSPHYMPKTRELSDGKRKLLERWSNLPTISLKKKKADKLTKIKGIGKIYQRRLNDIGINSFNQLAEADPDQLHQKLVDIDRSVDQIAQWVDAAKLRKDREAKTL